MTGTPYTTCPWKEPSVISQVSDGRPSHACSSRCAIHLTERTTDGRAVGGGCAFAIMAATLAGLAARVQVQSQPSSQPVNSTPTET